MITMATETTFWYKRYERVPKKDEKGITVGFIIVEAEDCVNLYDVIRGFWWNGETFKLQMKDGHEESVEKDMHPKIRKELEDRNKEIPREKRYLLSYIELHGNDIRRFRAATELMLPVGVELPEVIHPREIQPEKPQFDVTTSITSEPPTSETTSIPHITPTMKVVREEPDKEAEEIQEVKHHDIDLIPEEEVNTLE